MIMINAAWHKKHPMPKNPTLDQRMQWHLGHAKNCGCREMPEKLKEEFRKWKEKQALKE